MQIEDIRAKISAGQWEFSLHALEKMDERQIMAHDILQAMQKGEVLEDYSSDPRGHSCLVLGYAGEEVLHIVCGMRVNRLLIVTVYRPERPHWIDDRTRGRGTK